MTPTCVAWDRAGWQRRRRRCSRSAISARALASGDVVMTISGSVGEIDRHSHTRPRSARFHLFNSAAGHFALDVESGRIHQLPAGHAEHPGRDVALGRSGPRRAGGSGFRHRDPGLQGRSRRQRAFLSKRYRSRSHRSATSAALIVMRSRERSGGKPAICLPMLPKPRSTG